MEAALFKGFKYHLPDLCRLLCVCHLSKRDESKITKLCSNSKQNSSKRNSSKSEIVKDIYGSHSGNYYESGLASDKVDFEVKFASLKQKRESLCPTFHSWFGKRRSAKFITSVIQSARKDTDVKGLYYQNDVESMHFLDKLNQDFKKDLPKHIDETTKIIQKTYYSLTSIKGIWSSHKNYDATV